MAEIPFAAMRAVSERLERPDLDYAFLGGSVVGLLLDRLERSPVRPTDDVDGIIEVVSRTRCAETEAELRELKFDHDMRPGAPRYRWVLGNLTVDIMPIEGARASECQDADARSEDVRHSGRGRARVP